MGSKNKVNITNVKRMAKRFAVYSTTSPYDAWSKSEKLIAQKALNNAVKSGLIPHISTRTCVLCGSKAHVYHHWSYAEEDWFNVTPLCGSCHQVHHSQYNA